jgi:outer membrane immunogenic protein
MITSESSSSMERSMRRLLLAAAMLGTISAAHAADLSDLPILRGGFTDGLSNSNVNWQGSYIGAQGSYGTSDMNFTGSTRTVAAALLANTSIEAGGQVSSWPVGGGKVSSHGHGYGAFAGYNGQWDDVVLGVEVNYIHGKFGGSATGTMGRSFVDPLGFLDDITYKSTSSIAISDMGTLRIRGGYAVGSFLPYLFGGIALGQANITKTAEITGTQVNQSAPFQTINVNLSATDGLYSHLIYGYSTGIGVDAMLCAGLFLRAEWEYVRFTSSVDTSINTVRAGLGYKF